VEEAQDLRLEKAPAPILANDWHGGALTLARRAASSAGVENSITFTEGSCESFRPEIRPSLVVTNPPWDGRLEGGEEAWTQLRTFLKRECGGSRAWVLSGNKELTRHLRMRAGGKLRIENAGSALAYISYEVLKSREEADMEQQQQQQQQHKADDAPKPKAVATTVVVAADPKAAFFAGIHTEASLAQLTRTELQAAAKRHGVRANQKSTVIIEQLVGTAAADEVTVGEMPDNADIVGHADDAGMKVVAVANVRAVQSGKGTAQVADRAASAKASGKFVYADGTGREEGSLEDLFEGLYS